MQRCDWKTSDELMLKYHDTEWGTPVHDDTKLFEFLTLDVFQAGLSWRTILHKREAFREAFHSFNIEKVASMTENDVATLLKNKAIIRNRLKIQATINNAHIVQEIQCEFGSFDSYLWKFSNYKTIHNNFEHTSQTPATTPLSDEISKDMKKRGFKFAGSTIVYAIMQSIGMVNDHTINCFRHQELKDLTH
jgi:DNA-3-methyladenine glycosylase I